MDLVDLVQLLTSSLAAQTLPLKLCLELRVQDGKSPPGHKEVDLLGFFQGSDWCFEWSSPSLCPLWDI